METDSFNASSRLETHFTVNHTPVPVATFWFLPSGSKKKETQTVYYPSFEFLIWKIPKRVQKWRQLSGRWLQDVPTLLIVLGIEWFLPITLWANLYFSWSTWELDLWTSGSREKLAANTLLRLQVLRLKNEVCSLQAFFWMNLVY